MSHPDADLAMIQIPQVPGTLRRSRPVWGGAEGGLKTKRYLAVLTVIQPRSSPDWLSSTRSTDAGKSGREASSKGRNIFNTRWASSPVLAADDSSL